jgi:glycine cleavage system H protein
MSELPPELKYAESHEWARLDDDGIVTVGITDHAQDQLGDVIYVEVPDVGQVLAAGDEAGVVESVKAASDIYSPVSGEVIEVNEVLEDAPETINSEPFDSGWFFKIKPSDDSDFEQLLSADDYLSTIDS